MVRLILLIVLLASPLAAQERESLRLEVILDAPEDTPYEGEMILATIRGVYREKIALEDLKLRAMTDFDWMRLTQDAWSEQRIDNLPTRVMERRVAFFPKRAGDLEILPVAQELQIIGDGGKRRTVIVRSDPVRVTVRPKPVGAGDDWLPVRALELSDSWSADAGQLADGQSVERRVVLRALGAMPEILPAQPMMREPWLITYAAPEDRSVQVTPEGPVATVIWRWTMRPITGEPGVLPEVAIPWFDTIADNAATAVIPAAPIGYASFTRTAVWRSGIGTAPLQAGLFAAVLLAICGATLRGRGMERSDIDRLRERIRRWRHLRDLRRSVSRSDLAGFRAGAAELLRSAGEPEDARGWRLLAQVDAALFGGRATPDRATLRRLARQLSRHLKHRSVGKRAHR